MKMESIKFFATALLIESLIKRPETTQRERTQNAPTKSRTRVPLLQPGLFFSRCLAIHCQIKNHFRNFIQSLDRLVPFSVSYLTSRAVYVTDVDSSGRNLSEIRRDVNIRLCCLVVAHNFRLDREKHLSQCNIISLDLCNSFIIRFLQKRNELLLNSVAEFSKDGCSDREERLNFIAIVILQTLADRVH
jgi:hypothetical protein